MDASSYCETTIDSALLNFAAKQSSELLHVPTLQDLPASSAASIHSQIYLDRNDITYLDSLCLSPSGCHKLGHLSHMLCSYDHCADIVLVRRAAGNQQVHPGHTLDDIA